VRMNRAEPVRKLSREKTFLKSITGKLRASDESARENSSIVHFTNSKILWSDIERRSRRATLGAMPDMLSLSLVLRVLGDYLDRKAAGDSAISWSTNSVKVRYGQKDESFTVDNRPYCE